MTTISKPIEDKTSTIENTSTETTTTTIIEDNQDNVIKNELNCIFVIHEFTSEFCHISQKKHKIIEQDRICYQVLDQLLDYYSEDYKKILEDDFILNTLYIPLHKFIEEFGFSIELLNDLLKQGSANGNYNDLNHIENYFSIHRDSKICQIVFELDFYIDSTSNSNNIIEFSISLLYNLDLHKKDQIDYSSDIRTLLKAIAKK